MLKLLHEEITKKNIPFVDVELTDDCELSVKCLGKGYQITFLEEKKLYLLWLDRNQTSVCFPDITQIADYFSHRVEQKRLLQSKDIKEYLIEHLYAEDIVYHTPITDGTLASVDANIPHINNNLLRKIFGLNKYTRVNVLYNRCDNCYSISTRVDDKFVMLGMTKSRYDIDDVIVESLRGILGISVKRK